MVLRSNDKVYRRVEQAVKYKIILDLLTVEMHAIYWIKEKSQINGGDYVVEIYNLKD